MPPSLNQQMLALSCSIEYAYDAGSKTYTGTLTATLGDGSTSPSETMKTDLKARFTFTVQ